MGGRGGEESADVGFPRGKRAFCSCTGVRQSQQSPHSLGVGGAKTRAGRGPDSHRSEEHVHRLLPAACPPGSYKAKQGEGPCLPCPPNSRTSSPAASICTCHSNFYRADSDSADSACTSKYTRGLVRPHSRPPLGGAETVAMNSHFPARETEAWGGSTLCAAWHS